MELLHLLLDLRREAAALLLVLQCRDQIVEVAMTASAVLLNIELVEVALLLGCQRHPHFLPIERRNALVKLPVAEPAIPLGMHAFELRLLTGRQSIRGLPTLKSHDLVTKLTATKPAVVLDTQLLELLWHGAVGRGLELERRDPILKMPVAQCCVRALARTGQALIAMGEPELAQLLLGVKVPHLLLLRGRQALRQACREEEALGNAAEQPVGFRRRALGCRPAPRRPPDGGAAPRRTLDGGAALFGG